MSNVRNMSLVAGAFLLVNCMFGGGNIGIPDGFDQLGTLGGAISLFGSTLLTFLSLYFLIYSAKKTGYDTYNTLCKQIGKYAVVVYDVMVILLCYGCTISYFLFIVQFVRSFFNYFSRNVKIENTPFQVFLVGIVFVIPLYFISNLKTLDKLKFMSVVVLCATIYIATLFVFLYLTTPSKHYTDRIPTKLFNNGFEKGLPKFIFALGCQQTSLSIYSSLVDQSLINSMCSMGLGCLIGFGVYLIIGLFGYLTLGGRASDDKKNFLDVFMDKDHRFVKATCKSLAAIKIPFMLGSVIAFLAILIGAFAIQTFVARQSLIAVLRGKKKDEEKSSDKTIRIISNIVHFIALLGIAISGVDSSHVLGLIGSSVCPVISFIFPSLIFLRTKKGVGPVRIASGCMFLGSSVMACVLTANAAMAFFPKKTSVA